MSSPLPPGEAERERQLYEVFLRFGFGRPQLSEVLQIRALGARGARRPMDAARAARLDALVNASPAEILVALGWLGQDQVADFDAALRETPSPESVRLTPPGRLGGGSDRETLVDSPVPSPAPAPAAPAAKPAGLLPSGGAGKGDAEVRFGRYLVREEIGRGGMGIVYRAFDTELNREVALKLLLAGDGPSEEQVRRFQREARAAAKLSHPNIVSTYDVGLVEGRHYLTMEYLRGRSLAAHLAAHGGKLPPHESMAIVRDVAQAVGYAHSQGIVHRDLKPENILLADPRPGSGTMGAADARGSQGTPMVMDFGLARVIDDPGSRRLTISGLIVGTPVHMSPEQANGLAEHVDARTDVYSLGSVLYEMTTGWTPYEGETALQMVLSKLDRDPPMPRERNPQLARNVETIILKAMERDKHRRYAGAQELADDLGRCLAGETILARPVGRLERAWFWARRHRALAGLLAVTALALLAAGGSWWDRRRLERRAEVARAEREQLEREVLDALRVNAATTLEAVLELRRAGTNLPHVRENFLRTLEGAVKGALARAPGLAEPHYHLGRMYRALFRVSAALEQQDRALEKNPEYAPSRYERAVLRADQHRGRVMELRETWRRKEGERLARAGLLSQGGMTGAEPRAEPTDAELAARDETARGLQAAMVADLERLAARAGNATGPADANAPGITPGKLACARGLHLLHTASDRAGIDRACELLSDAIAGEPTLEEAYDGLALAESARGNVEGELDAYARGLAVDKGFLPHLLGRGYRLGQLAAADLAKGRDAGEHLGQAAADYDRAIELGPDLPVTWLCRGMVRLRRGWVRAVRGEDPREEYAAAESDFGKAVELSPRSVWAWTRRGIARMDQARSAEERGEEAGERYALAIADLEEAQRLDPDALSPWLRHGDALLYVGLARHARGEDPAPWFDRAERDYDCAVALNPRWAEAWLLRGTVRLNRGCVLAQRGKDPTESFARADADLDEALKIEPENAAALSNRGVARMNRGLHEARQGRDPEPLYVQAIEDHGAALAIDPRQTESWLGRAGAFVNRAAWRAERGGETESLYRQAEQDLGHALEINPRASDGWRMRGMVRKNLADAAVDRGADPGDGYLLAEKDLAKALELAPRFAEAWASRGAVRLSLGLHARARGEDPRTALARAQEDLEKALECNPKLETAWRTLGSVHLDAALAEEGSGGDPGPRYRRAEEAYGEALALNPGSEEAWRGRGRARMLRGVGEGERGRDAEGDFAKALADLDGALAIDPGSVASRALRAECLMNWGFHLEATGSDPDERFAQAEEDYGRALAGRAEFAEGWKCRGIVRSNRAANRLRAGQDARVLLAAALEDLDRALALNARDAEARWRRGWVGYLSGDWPGAVADFDAAIALAPSLAGRYPEVVDDARARARGQELAARHPWLATLARAGEQVAAGDYAAAGLTYEEGLAAFRAAQAGSEAERVLAAPGVREALALAHYNLACIQAVASTGRAAPGTAAGPIAPGDAAGLRDRAFANLAEAIRLGANDAEQMGRDEDLAPLRADSRWEGMMVGLRGR